MVVTMRCLPPGKQPGRLVIDYWREAPVPTFAEPPGE